MYVNKQKIKSEHNILDAYRDMCVLYDTLSYIFKK